VCRRGPGGFVLVVDGEAEAGDEVFDLLFGDLGGVEADGGDGFWIGGGAGGDSLLFGEQGVEAGGAGDATEAADVVGDDFFGCGGSGDGFERCQGTGGGDGQNLEEFSAKHLIFSFDCKN
jgi:hypothetical protein